MTQTALHAAASLNLTTWLCLLNTPKSKSSIPMMNVLKTMKNRVSLAGIREAVVR